MTSSEKSDCEKTSNLSPQASHSANIENNSINLPECSKLSSSSSAHNGIHHSVGFSFFTSSTSESDVTTIASQDMKCFSRRYSPDVNNIECLPSLAVARVRRGAFCFSLSEEWNDLSLSDELASDSSSPSSMKSFKEPSSSSLSRSRCKKRTKQINFIYTT